MCSYIETDKNNKTIFVYKNSYYNDLLEKNLALSRNIRRNTDFIIKVNDVKSNPFIILTSLFSNRTFRSSIILLQIILILLYIIMILILKELLEPPYFTIKDFYINYKCNYILNSIFLFLLIINIASNYFFYIFYRIDCFKTIIKISLIIITFELIIYHIITTDNWHLPINLNQYNLNMLSDYNRDKRSNFSLFIIFSIYFSLNGVIFYVYILILKISKTIYRNTFFAIHSISLIISLVLSECIYYQMENYFLFLGIMNILCLLTFSFLNEFKELLFLMNDLKIDIFRSSKNIQIWKKID